MYFRWILFEFSTTHFHISNFYLELTSPPAKSLRSVTKLSIIRIDIVTRYSKPSYLSHPFLEILLGLNLSVKLGWTIRFDEKICVRFARYLWSKWWPISSSRVTAVQCTMLPHLTPVLIISLTAVLRWPAEVRRLCVTQRAPSTTRWWDAVRFEYRGEKFRLKWGDSPFDLHGESLHSSRDFSDVCHVTSFAKWAKISAMNCFTSLYSSDLFSSHSTLITTMSLFFFA